jgi:BASS family bile acid:Na+ symporter
MLQSLMTIAGDVLLPIALWLVMFSVGTGLHPQDFRRTLSSRKAFLAGMGSMLVLVPLAGVTLAALFAPTPALVVGLILLATTPSGILSNLMTDIAGGDVALSVSISLALSVIYVFTLPFISQFALLFAFGKSLAIAIPLWSSLSHILMVTLIPIAVGMGAGRLAPSLASRFGPRIKSAATAVLVVVFALIVAQQFAVLKASFGRLMLIVIAMNLSAVALALLVSRLARLTRKETIAVSVEHMIRQEGTAIFVAVTLLHRDDMSIPMIINTFFGMALCIPFVAFMRRRRESLQPVPA